MRHVKGMEADYEWLHHLSKMDWIGWLVAHDGCVALLLRVASIRSPSPSPSPSHCIGLHWYDIALYLGAHAAADAEVAWMCVK